MTKKPLILAVETSGRAGSAAIGVGEKMLAETIFSGPARHSVELFPAIKDLLDRFGLDRQEIEHVYISIGPGSFTGLRIATTLAKAMHLALAVKIVAVNTLDCLAANIIDTSSHPALSGVEKMAPILDAKRNQFFVAIYQRTSHEPRASALASQEAVGGIWRKIVPDALMSASQFIERFARIDKPIIRPGSEPALSLSKGHIWLLGEGLLYHQDKFKAEGIRFFDRKLWCPRASKVYELGWQKAQGGQFADPLTLIPNYVRPPEVTIPASASPDASRGSGPGTREIPRQM